MITANQNRSQLLQAEQPGSDIVVTARSRPTDAAPLDIISFDAIDTFSAESIGEVIEAMQRRLAGRNAPVIINGRRLGSIEDIAALPAEAIERVEILPPSAGVQRGLGGGAPIMNVVLKSRFRSLTMTAAAASSTDGGGDDERIELTGASIKGERRTNVTLLGSRQGVLRYRDRFDRAVASGELDIPEPAASLRPASDALSIVAGKSVQAGQTQLSLSANGSLTGSTRDLGSSLGTQRNRSFVAGLSATMSGLAGQHFWTVIANGNASRFYSDTQSPGATAVASRSDTTGADFAANLSGPLLTLPMGAVSYHANVAFAQAWLSQSLDGAPNAASSRRSATGAFGVELPLHQRGPGASLLGDLSVRLQGQVSHATESDTLLGYENALSWSPVPWFTAEWSNAFQALGGSGQLGNVTVQPGVLVFDPVAQQSVRVRQITGGNPNLGIASQRRSGLRASVNRELLGADISATTYYLKQRTDNPIFSPSPSVLIEQAFPTRFVRDEQERLTEIDARSLNAYRQSSESLSFNFSASGPSAPPPQDERSRGKGSAARWTLSLNYELHLSERLQFTPTSPTLDLRSARIGAFGGASRNRLSGQAGISNAHFGSQVQVGWSSSTLLLGQGSGADGIYHQPFRIAIDAHVNLRNGNAHPDQGGRPRLSLSIDNLLNARPHVDFPDRPTPFALLPANLDPVGRLVRLSFRAGL